MQIGIVGCGNIGEVHAAVLSEMKRVKVCAFVDIRLKRAEEYSVRFTGGEAKIYGSLEDMIENEEVDVIHICSPHHSHVPMAIVALNKGIHVFMEKPPAISREQFEELSAVCGQSKSRLGICFQNRYNEATKKVNEILNQESLGRIKGGRAFVTWHRDASYYKESSWRGNLKKAGGGVLINQSIHTLDLFLSWLGKPIRIEATMSNHHLKGNIEVEDTLEVYMCFSEDEDPVSASFYATTAYATDAPVFLEFVCEKGFVRLEGNVVQYQTEAQQEPLVWKARKASMPGKTYWGSGHEDCIRDFYDCLETGKVYRNDLDSVRTTFDTMIDIYDSARNKRR
ncbi:Gfo/Idh/MocA family protein [Konateibacter massiliensis]|uniref:Gfo/Idh/MocA family protein n=1 Tax=Konateibacter massiliensis TaxID=2002841 RepID=UPI000C148134|nr:Gfo/Idh/MocA family oxidoreductase [Konateibacter massiliensis]